VVWEVEVDDACGFDGASVSEELGFAGVADEDGYGGGKPA